MIARADANVSRPKVEPAREVRSTLIASSLAMIRERNLFDEYVSYLDPRDRDEIVATVPGMWVPIERIVKHYAACDRLPFSPSEIVQLGRGLTARLHQPVLATALRLVGAAGVTPWTLAGHAEKIWTRMYRGGAMIVNRLGPKDGRVDILGFPCAGIPYSRLGFRGVIAAGAELFSSRAYVTEIPALCDDTSLAYRVAWV